MISLLLKHVLQCYIVKKFGKSYINSIFFYNRFNKCQNIIADLCRIVSVRFLLCHENIFPILFQEYFIRLINKMHNKLLPKNNDVAWLKFAFNYPALDIDYNGFKLRHLSNNLPLTVNTVLYI